MLCRHSRCCAGIHDAVQTFTIMKQLAACHGDARNESERRAVELCPSKDMPSRVPALDQGQLRLKNFLYWLAK